MTCNKVKSLIFLYREGELSGSLKAKLEAHISSCEKCRDEYKQAAALGEHILSARTNLLEFSGGTGLTENIMSAINMEENIVKDSASKDFVNTIYDLFTSRLFRYLAYLFLLAALFSFSYLQFNDLEKLSSFEEKISSAGFAGSYSAGGSITAEQIRKLEEYGKMVLPDSIAISRKTLYTEVMRNPLKYEQLLDYGFLFKTGKSYREIVSFVSENYILIGRVLKANEFTGLFNQYNNQKDY